MSKSPIIFRIIGAPTHRADVPADACSLIIGTRTDGSQFRASDGDCDACAEYTPRHAKVTDLTPAQPAEPTQSDAGEVGGDE